MPVFYLPACFKELIRMYIIKRIGIISFIVFCCQCSKHTIEYEGAIIPEQTEHLASNILNDTFLFSWPKDLMILDSLLIVHDSYQQTKCFHIFRKSNGEFLKSFGQKGRGPGEFMDINSVNNRDGLITVYDPNYRKIVVFDLVDLLQNQESYYQEFIILNAPNFIKQALYYQNNFILKGNTDKLRYAFWDPSSQTFHSVYNDYPQLSEDRETNWSLTDYGVKVRLSPGGNTLVATTYIGGILEIFNIDNNCLKLKNIRYFFEPRYGYAQGAKPRWVTTSPKSIIGFENVFLTDDAIYGLVWGVEKSKMETCKPQLVRFDQNGNPVKSYTLDDTLESMAVDNDGTIYGVGYDSNGRYKLCRYTPKTDKKSL